MRILILMLPLAAALAAAPAALAQDCEIAELFRFGGGPADALIAHGHAFIAAENGVEVVRVDGPDAPWLLHTLVVPYARSVAAQGDLLLVAADATDIVGHGLRLFDISQAPQITPLGSLAWPTINGYSGQLSVRGAIALVADGADGARVVDISDPQSPLLRATIPAPGGGSVASVAMLDGAAALIDSNGALTTFDMADPDAPAPLAFIPGPVGTNALADGSLVYTLSDTGLVIVDVSNPAAPDILSSLAVASARDLSVSGDTVSIIVLGGSLVRVDVSDPAAPFIIDEGFPEAGISASPFVVASTPDLALLVSGRQNRLINVAAAPVPAGAQPRLSSLLRGLATEGDSLLVGQAYSAQMARLNSDGSIDLLGEFPYSTISLSSGGKAAALGGDRALVATRSTNPVPQFNHQLLLLNISDPAAPQLVASGTMPDTNWLTISVERMALAGPSAFVLLRSTQTGLTLLRAYDLDDPAFLQIGAWAASDFALGGSTIFTLEGSFLRARDAAQPAALPELDAVGPLPAYPFGWEQLRIDSDRAYVLSSRREAIAVIDIADPSNMQLLGVAPLPPGYASAAAMINDFEVLDAVAYIAAWTDSAPAARRLSAFDLGDPTVATLLAQRDADMAYASRAPTTTTPTGVLIAGVHFAAVACPCPADLNLDGFVDMADLMLAIDAFNTVPSDPAYNPAADANGDNAVDFADLNLVLSAFNTGC